jgi:predicted GTPase
VSSSPENLYLFFDKEFLQTARFGRWKIHVARWNVQRYQAGAANQINQTLKAPELYDMSLDVGENYNVAANHPDAVRDLQRRIAEKLRTFPEEIRKANADLLR